jgi:glycosyltransferase involved in cell wall biosynthesis
MDVKALRLLEISSYPPPRAGWGVRVSFLKRHVLAAGGDCRVLNIGKCRKIKSDDYIDVQGLWDYLRKVWRFARRGYLFHTHINGDGNKGWWLSLAAELIARLNGCRVVLTMHAGPLQRYFPRNRAGIFTLFYRAIFGMADKIICNNEAVKEGIVQFGVPADKIHPIQAFSKQYLAYETVELPAELESFLLAHRPVAVVYFFLRPEFFIDSLLDALRRLKADIPQLGIIAVGMETHGERFAAMIEGAGISDIVYPAGDMDHDLFMTLMARADYYVRTPAKDGVCSSVLEALSLGVPVVASENDRRPESVLGFTTDSAEALHRVLLDSWHDYENVRRSVVRPPVPDTVATEVELLLEVAGR